MDFTCGALLSRGSESILDLKNGLPVVHFYLRGLSPFWGSKYGSYT